MCASGGRRFATPIRRLHNLFGDDAVCGVYVVLKLFVHAERSRAHGTLVGEVCWLQNHPVIAGHVLQQLTLEHAATNRTPTTVLTAVGGFLHRARNQTMRPQEVALQTLVGEKAQLTLLAVERRPVEDHFRVDLNFVNPLHVVAQLFQILYIAIADFTDNKRALIELLRLLSGALFGSGRRGHPGDGHMSGGTRARPQ